MPDQIGSTHSWNWTSYLALECASHSVRISLQDNIASSWMQEKTLPGRKVSTKPEVYPRDKVFEVGSTATFCCIMPPGQVFNKLYLTGYNASDATKISDHTYALTVLLNQPSEHSCTDVKCQSSNYGACAYIGYPPDDRDLWCETRDLESVDCHWSIGRKTHLHKPSISTKYQLNGRDCPERYKASCSQRIEAHSGEREWMLTAKNKLGRKDLIDRSDLRRRVHMFAPEELSSSSVNARNITLMWKWRVQRYVDLDITCQINISDGETSTEITANGVGLLSAIVKDLIPNWNYIATVRCGTTQHFWKWSNWSQSVNFQTRGDVPDALDVWMQRTEDQTVILWKELQAEQSHGEISEYEVSWKKTSESELQNQTKVDKNDHSVALNLDRAEEHIVTVTARNINGSSAPSTIIIPPLSTGSHHVDTNQISGSDGGFYLSWSPSPAASCGYVVDWCLVSESCRVEWMKVTTNESNARIVSENFIDGQRYLLSVYACTLRAPVLLERREGYVKEKIIEKGLFQPLQWKQHHSDVEVFWRPVPLRNQSAFIHGYVLYYTDNNNKLVLIDSTDNPEATRLTAPNLKIHTYTFTVKAKTAAGEGGDSVIIVTLNSLTDNLIQVISISLIVIFALLSLVTILCYRHWSCIKHKVYPPIPKPVLTDKWLATVDNRCHPLCVDQYVHSEISNMAVPELFRKPAAPVNHYVIQGNDPYISVQTINGYCNHAVDTHIPQPLIIPTTDIPTQQGTPSPPFRSLFPNPSYDLTMETEYEPFSQDPQLQEGTLLGKGCDGYQPQTKTEFFCLDQKEERPDSPMSCVSTYVLLPQSPHV
ncbi:leukemia inhibitory factor receptor-like isoform X2 [Cheilinus undulatus]|nr:leukemia inhibitory factor receptor-like isoform X2 [Cheilinus undulatus]